GISTTARNRMILVSRPNRGLEVFMARSSCLHGRRPVGNRDPPLPFHAGEVHAVETLVTLGAERQRGPDAEIEVLERLQRLAEAEAGRIRSRPPPRLDDDLGVDA